MTSLPGDVISPVTLHDDMQQSEMTMLFNLFLKIYHLGIYLLPIIKCFYDYATYYIN